jgi:hypothetical protein
VYCCRLEYRLDEPAELSFGIVAFPQSRSLSSGKSLSLRRDPGFLNFR